MQACERLPEKSRHFEGTGCVEEPAVAVLEIQLSTLAMHSSVSSAPEATAPDLATMVADVQDTLVTAGCIPGDSPLVLLGPGDADVQEFGDLTLVFLSAGDPFAGGLVDNRSAEVVLTWQGEPLSSAVRCTPAITADPHDFERAPAPAHTFTYLGSGSSGGTYGLMDDLNHWGATWAESSGEYWIVRSFSELEEIIRTTQIANAFASCGTWDMTAISMTAGGGSSDGDPDDLSVIFILAGESDGVVLD
jgi:hypothetical protein